jgi:ABC-type transport system substrate-binding protein
MVVNDSGYLATAGVDGTIATVPNGTGPWKVDSWVNGEQIVLSRFDGYWGEKAKVKQLVITWQPEGNARLLQVQAGLADGASSIISDDYATAEGDASLALFKRAPIAITLMPQSGTSAIGNPGANVSVTPSRRSISSRYANNVRPGSMVEHWAGYGVNQSKRRRTLGAVPRPLLR